MVCGRKGGQLGLCAPSVRSWLSALSGWSTRPVAVYHPNHGRSKGKDVNRRRVSGAWVPRLWLGDGISVGGWQEAGQVSEGFASPDVTTV